MRSLSILIGMISLVTAASAQEMLGVVNSNYAGVLGSQINPSSMVSSRLFHDVHILSTDLFFQNNYLLIPKEDYRFLNYLSPGSDLPTYGEDKMLFARRPDWDHKRKQIDQSFRINGPSVMLAQDYHAISFFTSVRSMTSVWRLPYHLANFIYEDLWYEPQHDIEYNGKNFSSVQLTWAELGAGYALVLNRHSTDRWTAGITVSRTMGYSGAYIYGHNIAYLVRDESDTVDVNLTANIHNFDGHVGFSLPINYDNNDFSSPGGLFRGGGYSVSLGVTYLKLLKDPSESKYKYRCEQLYEDYRYRLGISLIDLGWITFRENAQKHLFDDVHHYWEYINDVDFNNLNSFMRQLSGRFYDGDSTRSLVDDRITVYLPTALSAQLDFHFKKKWYVNSMIIIPVMYSIAQVYRPPQVVLTGRYETTDLEITLPVSLYYFTRPRVGLSARFRSFTLGTDHIGGFFHFTDFTGINFYAVIKINFSRELCLRLNKKNPCGSLQFE
ncbi:MAG TPA: DUF5723 family protein [Bacteroidales bacterium]|nr:DUF5723 family protein [Bacteroidales bacterium]HRZ20550.1 DUF5723 family protein [Bacteroidales bacterium]